MRGNVRNSYIQFLAPPEEFGRFHMRNGSGKYFSLMGGEKRFQRISPELQTERILRLARRVCTDTD